MTLVIHRDAARGGTALLGLGALALAAVGISASAAVDTEASAAPVWDLVGALGLFMIVIGVELASTESPPPVLTRNWPSPTRLLPTLLVALSLGMALGHGVRERWLLSDVVVTVILVIALITRQVLSFLEERRLAVTIASQGQALRHQALHDPLTQLANRDLFYDRLEHALTLRQRAFTPLAVMHIDINNFADVNERYGHGTGDAMLVAFADRLATWVRPADTVARLGGDEFAIIIDGTQDAAMVVAERIRSEVARGFDHSGHSIRLNISIGVAALERVDPEVSDTITRLLNEADRAMHRSSRDSEHPIVLVRVD
jgi:diguanylate cyclase (GGDEF)-like protein